MRIRSDDNANEGFISGSGTKEVIYYYYCYCYCYYWEQTGRDKEIENKKAEKIL